MDEEFGTFSYGKQEMRTPEQPGRPSYERQRDYGQDYGKASQNAGYRADYQSEYETGYRSDYGSQYGKEYGLGNADGGQNARRTEYGQEYDRGFGQSYGQSAHAEEYGRTQDYPAKTGGASGNGPSREPSRRTPEKKKKSGTGRSFLLVAALAIVFGVIASGVFIGMNKLFGDKKGGEEASSATASADPNSIAQQTTVDPDKAGTMTVSYDVAELVKKAQPSTVSITTLVTTSYQYYFQQYEREATGAGSGIIIRKTDDQLYIATNYHVIEDAKEINVGFIDGQILKARVTGYDSDADVAVIQIPIGEIPESTAQAISVAAIGDSDELQVGEPAIAIGNAMGYGQSVTVGYISALNRSISGNNRSYYIQTDAAINPGNSGGALFNAKGEVIGINSVKYVDSKVEGMGFSIPINKAMNIINSLITNGTRGKIYIGVTGATITQEYSQVYGFPVGIYIKSILENGPAEDAGLCAGDIITSLDGRNVATMDELIELLQTYKSGDTVEVEYQRADNMGRYSSGKTTVTLAQE